MKKKILLLMGIFSIGILCAQVGINTNNPQRLFHIDPKGDTNGTDNTSDDVIVTESGNIGIGTIAPTSKLHIKTDSSVPGLRIVDGNEDEDHILVSDAAGNATWKPNDLSSPGVIVWEAIHNSYVFKPVGVWDPIFTAQSFTFKTYNMSSPVPEGFNAGLHLPSGIYLMFLNGTVDNESYLTLQIASSPITSSASTNVTMATYFCEHYISGSAYLSYNEDSRINVAIQNYGLDGRQKTGIMIGDTNPHRITFRITLLKIA